MDVSSTFDSSSCSSLSVHKSRLEPAMRGRWKLDTHAAETHESVMPPEKTTSREFTWNISRCLASPHESFFVWVSLSLSFSECVDPAYGNPGRLLHLRRHGLTGIKGRATRITSFFHHSSSHFIRAAQRNRASIRSTTDRRSWLTSFSNKKAKSW